MEIDVINVGDLLQQVSEDAPCGDNLEYDGEFGELERAAEGKPEQQIGDVIQPAEEPDWKQVQRLALSLLKRTKDLRVAVPLCAALVRTGGYPGLHDGLALIHGLLEQFWDSVHPELDPDDNLDPTFRLNTLVTLADPKVMLYGVRETPLVSSRALGRYGLRDLDIAQGRLSAPADMAEPPTESIIEAAFMDSPVEDIQAMATSVGGCLTELTAINRVLDDRVGAGMSPDLSSLKALLQQGQQTLNEQLARRGGTAVPTEEGTVPDSANPAAAPAAAAVVPGALASREDVVRALDAICDYYKRFEPSSPIPLLLQRARRLVTKDFMEIIRDLMPNAVAQVEELRGPESE